MHFLLGARGIVDTADAQEPTQPPSVMYVVRKRARRHAYEWGVAEPAARQHSQLNGRTRCGTAT